MTKFYTLISYLEGEDGYTDRCGNYIYGKDSEMTIKTYPSNQLEKLIEDYATLKLNSDKNHPKEFTLLLDGIDTNNFPDGLTQDEESLLEQEYCNLEKLVEQKFQFIQSEAIQKAEEAEKKAKEIAIKTQIEKQRIAEQKLIDAELQQLASLQAKYKNRI